MIANYHSHTTRCGHAFGTEEEYVLAAIDGGFRILGFSDHTPQFFPGDYYSRMRMRPEELQGYVDTVMGLKKQYEDKLQIHLGLEVEYYPAIFPKLVEVLRDHPIEYIILGQHWNGNEEGFPYNGRPTENVDQLIRHCDQLIEAIYTGQFTYLAHPDILNFIGDDRVYAQHMRRVCKVAKSCDLPLEINFVGLMEERQYPRRLFWELAAEEGCCAVFGSDAHRPENIAMPDVEAKAQAMVDELGLQLLSTVELKKI